MIINRFDFLKSLSEEEFRSGHLRFNLVDEDDIIKSVSSILFLDETFVRRLSFMHKIVYTLKTVIYKILINWMEWFHSINLKDLHHGNRT